MQKSGTARKDQPGVVSTTTKHQQCRALTNSDGVGEPTKGAQAELGQLDLLAALPHGDGDGGGVRKGKADDTDTGEGVEGGSRTEVDDTKDDLDSHREHHGVEREVELLVDDAPPLGAGDGTVTRERPSAARRGGGAGGTAENGEDHEREKKTDRTSLGTDSRLDDGGNGLAGGEGDEHGEVGKNKHEGNKEKETTDSVDNNGHNHGLGDLGSGRLDLLAHGDDHTSRGSCVRGVKDTDHERPSGRPARGRLKVAKGVGARAAALLGDSENGNHDADETGKRPDNSKGLCGSCEHTMLFKGVRAWRGIAIRSLNQECGP